MKTIEEIRAEMRAIEALAETEERELTPEEMDSWEALETDVKVKLRSAEIRKRQAAYDTPVNHVGVHVAPAKEDDTEVRAFADYLRTGRANSDLETRGQSEGSPSAGGYLVPQTVASGIEQRLLTYGGVEREAKILQTPDGGDYIINRADDTANKAVFVSELNAPTTGGADLAFDDPVRITSHSMTSNGANNDPIAVSYQLARDYPDITGYIADRIVERFGRGLAYAWVNGNGVGQPHGIVTNTVTEATFTAAAPSLDELVDAQHRIDPAYRTDAVWIFNDTTLAKIRKLVDGINRPLWTPSAESGLESAIGGVLLGHRVVIDQGFADYTDGGTNRWGVFGSVKTGYLCRKVAGMRLIVDEYSGKAKGQIEYTAHIDVDGAPIQPRAYAVLKNS